MPPRFKRGDTVRFDNPPQKSTFGKPKKKEAGSVHVVVDVLPFTLSEGLIVKVKDLGVCTVIRVVGNQVKVSRLKDSTEPWLHVTDVDVDRLVGTPIIPSYELKGRTSDDQLGDTFWAPENTLTLVEAAPKPDPNVFRSTTWHRPGAWQERRSTRKQPSKPSNQSATKSWLNF
jgi:hypothetical protein